MKRKRTRGSEKGQQCKGVKVYIAHQKATSGFLRVLNTENVILSSNLQYKLKMNSLSSIYISTKLQKLQNKEALFLRRPILVVSLLDILND